MQWKKLSCLVVVFFCVYGCSSPEEKTKQPKKTAAYNLDIPKGWSTERIAFPIPFAPGINYTGVEDIRFAPGFDFVTSEEHWSYVFLWFIDGKPTVDTATLAQDLRLYYAGLISSNSRQRARTTKDTSISVTINKANTLAGDLETYNGIITLPDYMDVAGSSITLHCIAHKKQCDKNTALLFEMSPRVLEHAIWKDLHAVNDSFICGGR
jgi:hypothetical protein